LNVSSSDDAIFTPDSGSKLAQVASAPEVSWVCWEPRPERRRELRVSLSQHGIRSEVPDSVDAIPDESVSVVLMANLVHELNPKQFAEAIDLSVKKTKPATTSCLTILEIFPLLDPEKYAMPYPDRSLLQIFMDLGYTANVEQVAVRGGVSHAYRLVMRQRPDMGFSVAKAQKRIEETWDQRLIESVNAYANRPTIRQISDYANVIQELATIASVEAWRRGYWV
jgi:hypothetical protein